MFVDKTPEAVGCALQVIQVFREAGLQVLLNAFAQPGNALRLPAQGELPSGLYRVAVAGQVIIDLRNARSGQCADGADPDRPAIRAGRGQVEAAAEFESGLLSGIGQCIGFIDHYVICQLQDTTFYSLEVVSRTRLGQQKKGIRHTMDAPLRLTNAHRFDEDVIVARSFTQQDGGPGISPNATEVTTGRAGPNKHLRQPAEGLHTCFVSQNTASAEAGRGIDGQDGQLMSPPDNLLAEGLHERRFPHARGTTDTEAESRSGNGFGRQVHEAVGHYPVLRPGGFEQGDGAAKGAPGVYPPQARQQPLRRRAGTGPVTEAIIEVGRHSGKVRRPEEIRLRRAPFGLRFPPRGRVVAPVTEGKVLSLACKTPGSCCFFKLMTVHNFPPATLRIQDLSPADQPREKLLRRGARALSDAEIIAILLGSGVQGQSVLEVARRLLLSVDHDLDALALWNVADFRRLKGIGQVRAIRLMAALELGRRRETSAGREKPELGNSRQTVNYLRPLLADLAHEEFHLLCLNRANRLLGAHLISKGGVTATVADAKIIFRAALSHGSATSLVLAHNHPSGQAFPSEADINLTRKLVQAARHLDLQIVDHIIIAGRKYYSFADEGMVG